MKNLLWTSLAFIYCVASSGQQQPSISIEVDSTHIRIGEQINYSMRVEADTTAQVLFPEPRSFAPLEVIEDFNIDTLRLQARYRLVKKYGLSQYDSGVYRIPRQKILIDGKEYFTDSLRVYVSNVVVDTVKKNFYDIKPMASITPYKRNWLYPVLILIGVIGLLAFILWYFVFRKRSLSEEEKIALLAPYDRAKLALKKLDESPYLLKDDYKQFYSELTDIYRVYLQEETEIPALESTTEQLLDRLELYADAKELKIGDGDLADLREILEKADLIKFARAKVAINEAETDRSKVDVLLDHTKNALPEPTEEDLLETLEYAEILRKKRRRKRILIGVALSVLLMIGTAAGFIRYYGFSYVIDTLLGHPTKELLEGQWVRSEYGVPPVIVETPKVLKRRGDTIPEPMKGTVNQRSSFAFGSFKSEFYIELSATTFTDVSQFDLQKIVDNTVKVLESYGASNVLLKQDEYSTPSGKKGIKAYGSLDMKLDGHKESERMEYIILNFAENGGYQELFMLFRKDDTYAEEIVTRVMASLDFKKMGIDVGKN